MTDDSAAFYADGEPVHFKVMPSESKALRFYKADYRPIIEQKPIMELMKEINYGLEANHPALLRIKELEAKEKHAGSHHGPPDLMQRDIALLEAYTKWVQIAKETGYKEYEKEWMPRYPDWIKSRLFWRIRSGREPLKYPPPRAYSCPWYELIEVAGPHDAFEGVREYEGNKVYIAQCQYDVISKEGEIWTLGYGPYRFRAWNGPITRKKVVGKTVTDVIDECGWIEYTGIEEPTKKDSDAVHQTDAA